MKISEKWLREWVSPELDTQSLADQLTMAGLEIDAIEPVAGEFSGVIVAEIVSTEPHPDADKLRVCQVNTGADTLQIVCGAPNARAGLKAPLATVGGELPGDFKIKAAKLRGVESQGMLCAEQELGLSEAAEGLMELAEDAPVGACLRDYLQLDDQLLEIGLTPNRADCLSIRGIAREVALLNGIASTQVQCEPVTATIDTALPIVLQASERCPHFTGRVIRNVDLGRPSPLWLREKLRRCGLRSIDAVVDVTNYVMLELGQPMHAFDFDRLQGGITVRTAQADEPLALLDGSEVKLTEDVLVIADDHQALAMAGIMGGAHSAVSSTTTNLFLEVAFFTPHMMAGKARAYGMHTDASHRFERGVDFDLQVQAMERATQLLLEIVGGDAGPITEETAPDHLPARPDVLLRSSRISKLLGFEMASAEVERILTGLGLGVATTADGWNCSVPSWRFDIAIEEDLLEELARVYGYNNLPVSHVHADLKITARSESHLSERQLREHLAARGYHEAITYSFVDPKLQAMFDPGLSPVPLTNPISADMSVMRTSLIPGLVDAALRNAKRQQPRATLFETGLTFIKEGEELRQVPTLAMIVMGTRAEESWAEKTAPADFYDLKGDVESLLSLGRQAVEFSFAAGERDGLHPGQTATITHGGRRVGYIGALHPSIARELGLDMPLFACEMVLAPILQAQLPTFAELSKFPEIRRDVAIVVDRDLPVAELLTAVESAAGELLANLTLFDVYIGEGIDPKRKSLALGLTFRDQSRTLGDEDVNPAVGQVIDLLEKNYNAELRN